MRIVKLYVSMIGTLALIIGVSTLLITIILSFIGVLNLSILLPLVVGINLIQWLIAPYIIDMIYRVEEADPVRYSWLHEMVERISLRSGLKKPKVMIAKIPIPNAFAYGSPLTGNRVAVTEGLIDTLDREEIEAVIGHEIGHLLHKDMHVMVIASLLPAILFIIGRSLLWSGMYYTRREERSGAALLVGLIAIVGAYILHLLVLGLSRLREYYADIHSASVVKDGALKLQVALAKLVNSTARLRARGLDVSSFSGFKALFITDPDKAIEEVESVASIPTAPGIISRRELALVERIKRRELTLADRIIEIFSTHPNIVKRLRALDELRKEIG